MHGLQSDLCHFYIAGISRLYDWCEDCFNSHCGYIQTQTYSKLSCLLTSCFHPRYLLFHHVSPFLGGFRYLPLVLRCLKYSPWKLSVSWKLSGRFLLCPEEVILVLSEWVMSGSLRRSCWSPRSWPSGCEAPEVPLRMTPLEARSLCMYQCTSCKMTCGEQVPFSAYNASWVEVLG
jgi:hypothetical protein